MKTKCQFGCKTVKNWMNLMAWAAVFCLMVVGCGGGGGGGGTAPGVTYSGLETPADITGDNAQVIAAGALEAGSSGAGFTGIAALDGPGQAADEPEPLFLMDVTKALQGAVEGIDLVEAANQQNTPSAVQTVNEQLEPGNCGGTASITISLDDQSGQFNGSFTFNSYCQDGTTMNGNTSLSGSADMSNPDNPMIVSFTINFSYFTVTSASSSVAMAGQITMALTYPTVSVTMDMRVQEGDRVSKVENYQMDITDMGGYEEIDVSGRFFDQDYGYVDLLTPDPLQVFSGNEYPSAGYVVLTGKPGTAGGFTSIRLTALSDIYCQVLADTDGDGAYDGPGDYDSGEMLWTEL